MYASTAETRHQAVHASQVALVVLKVRMDIMNLWDEPCFDRILILGGSAQQNITPLLP